MAALRTRALLISCVFLALNAGNAWSENERLLSVRRGAFGRLEAVEGRIQGAPVTVAFKDDINSTGYTLHTFTVTDTQSKRVSFFFATV